MKVAVAGGTGFIGTHVVHRLMHDGHQVRMLARRPHEVPPGAELTIVSMEDPLATNVLDGCDAVINLVGIAHARDPLGFERAHVDVVRHLLDAAAAAGVLRFVHVSVVDVPGTTGPYVETKRRAEEHVRDSGLDWIILRPSMVYGDGDVALHEVVDGISRAPLFPVPAGSTGSLQPVDVDDVAFAVVRALSHAPRETIDVVGPEHLDVRRLVGRVGDALELPVRPLPVPRWAMRLGATVLERVLARPPLTRAQLVMLTAGLHGDLEQTRALLGRSPTALSPERIRSLAGPPPKLSLRLVTSLGHRTWLRGFETRAGVLPWAVPLILVVYLALSSIIASPWASLGLANVISLVLVLVAMGGVAWRELWRPSWRRLGVALTIATVMVGAALGIVAAIRRWLPEVAAGADEVYAWASLVSPWIALPVLLAIVAAEDWLWRGAVTLPLAAKVGPWRGCILAGALFGAAHWMAGPPVLILAAFLAGTIWSALTVRTRSLFVTVCCHATWDVAILTLSP